jgi:hypothetical protein
MQSKERVIITIREFLISLNTKATYHVKTLCSVCLSTFIFLQESVVWRIVHKNFVYIQIDVTEALMEQNM